MSRPIAFQASPSQPIGVSVLIGQSLPDLTLDWPVASSTGSLPIVVLYRSENSAQDKGEGGKRERTRRSRGQRATLPDCACQERAPAARNTRPEAKHTADNGN